MRQVKGFFSSKVFAVMGASRDSQKVGNVIFKNLLKADKHVVGINPSASKIYGHKIFPDLDEVPYKIDCLIIATPAKTVPLILRQAGKLKISNIIIISAGFEEVGNKELSKRIFEIAKEEKLNILGPNTFGFLDAHTGVNTTFFEGKLKPGKISFISQSGAIGSAILDRIGSLSSFVAIGNGSQIDFSSFIEYYSQDKNTDVICIYMESLKEGKGKRFIEVCRKCRKPIIVLKAGKSQEGQKAAKSHTAALASDYNVYSGILKQAKVTEVDSIDEMFGIAKIYQKHGKLGNRAMIITNAGGLGVLTSDYCSQNNVQLAKLDKKTIEKLDLVLPKTWSHNNPIDIIGDATSKRYTKTLAILDKENTFDYFIVLLTPQFMSEPKETANMLLNFKKPIFTCFLGGQQVQTAREFMKRFGITNFSDPKKMCEMLGKVIG